MEKFEKVTFEREIAKIMRTLYDASARLVIRFEGEDFSCRARLVGIDEESATLGISSLTSKEGDSIMPAGERLTVATAIGGMECLFETTLVYKSTTHGAHELAYPKVLRYMQRRGAYRVDTAGTGLTTTCDVDGVGEFSGDVVDISATGLRFSATPADNAKSIAAEMGVSQCRVSLAGVGHAQFSGVVRFVNEQNGKILVSVEISKIDNPDQSRIERYVSLRDLELRRQSSGI